ncbi:hypothetical protein [Paenibacillus arenosi]|uniref:Uncharacterized protein n=1 Tax=Paenibacillus arenosi TaxID=2774142 RepID=A0ABR9AZH3_9BACL|nr:hypothetical protein [Paenibacillus arenosi]MBD8499485.1 hypothetical protein [Paenibacillus arenosi]
MRKMITVLTTFVLLLFGAASAFAASPATSNLSSIVNDPAFGITATYTGKDANGNHHVQLSWDNRGSNVTSYTVYRYPTLYPWGGEVAVGCANLTTTSCEHVSTAYGQYGYVVRAYYQDGSVVQSKPAIVNIHKYSGSPATPVIYATEPVNGSFTVGFNITSGNNADRWELKENGQGVLLSPNYTGSLIDNGQEPQHASQAFYNKPSGTYVYQVKLINSYGTSLSSTITVVVP